MDTMSNELFDSKRVGRDEEISEPEVALDPEDFAVLEKLVLGQSAALIQRGNICIENGHVVKLWLGSTNLVRSVNMLGHLNFLRDLSLINFNSIFIQQLIVSILVQLGNLRYLSLHNVSSCTPENTKLTRAISEHPTIEIATILSNKGNLFGRRKGASWEWLSGAGGTTKVPIDII